MPISGLPPKCTWRVYNESSEGADSVTYRLEGLPINDADEIELSLSEPSVLHFTCQDQTVTLQLPCDIDESNLCCNFNRCMGAFSVAVPRHTVCALTEPAEPTQSGELDDVDQASCSSSSDSCEQGDSSEDEVDQDYAALGLLAPGVAQRTNVVVLPQLLSLDEIAELRRHVAAVQAQHAVGVVQRGTDGLQSDAGVWRTCYLHTQGHFAEHCPQLRLKLLNAIKQVDEDNWQCLSGRDSETIHFRTVECHQYCTGGQLSERKHYDSGSLITLDVMLSQPGVDFEGGSFITPNADGTVNRPPVNQGDGIFFLSHKYVSSHFLCTALTLAPLPLCLTAMLCCTGTTTLSRSQVGKELCLLQRFGRVLRRNALIVAVIRLTAVSICKYGIVKSAVSVQTILNLSNLMKRVVTVPKFNKIAMISLLASCDSRKKINP